MWVSVWRERQPGLFRPAGRTGGFRRRLGRDRHHGVAVDGVRPVGRSEAFQRALDADGAEMSSCFIIPGDATCSGTCRCRSFPNIVVTVMDEDNVQLDDIGRFGLCDGRVVEGCAA